MMSAILTILASLMAANLHGDLVLIRRWRPISDSRKHYLIRVLDRFVLGFSDQQLITGVSILLIGFIRFCSISTYHFYVITNLAKFSCSSHLASILSLRRYFQAHPRVAKIRIIVLLLFAVLLATASIIGGSVIPNIPDLKCPISCTIRNIDPSNKIFGWVSVIYLIIAYWAALAFVFPNSELFFTTWMVIKPATWIEAALTYRYGHQFQERFMHYKPYFVPLFASFILQLIWWTASLIISLLIRIEGARVVDGSETSWGFGQLLAMLMLGLPVLNAVELLYGALRFRASHSMEHRSLTSVIEQMPGAMAESGVQP